MDFADSISILVTSFGCCFPMLMFKDRGSLFHNALPFQHPVTAQKIYYWTFDKSMTELAIVSTDVNMIKATLESIWPINYFKSFL